MDQQVPFPDAKNVGRTVLMVPLSKEIKYIKQDVIREDVDRCRASTRFTYCRFSTNQAISAISTHGSRQAALCAPEDGSFGKRRLLQDMQ
jgi:hypothetical protein